MPSSPTSGPVSRQRSTRGLSSLARAVGALPPPVRQAKPPTPHTQKPKPFQPAKPKRDMPKSSNPALPGRTESRKHVVSKLPLVMPHARRGSLAAVMRSVAKPAARGRRPPRP